jgi:hypothetical protein
MKKTLLIIISICIVSSLFSQTEKHHYKDLNKTVDYETKNGMLWGSYTSYYPDGIKKAEGRIEGGYKIGKWTIWDTTGAIKVQRIYKNPLEYENIIFKITMKDSVDIYFPNNKRVENYKFGSNKDYKIEYNKDGFIDWSNLAWKDLFYKKRVWRTIYKENNNLFFDNNRLVNCLYKEIINKNITAYKPNKDDELIDSIPPNEFVEKFDTNKIKIIGFKIKEDNFFDASRVLSEYRVIGICPIGVIKGQTPDTVNLFWVYYPYTRKYLAKVKVTAKDVPSYINTLDDVFFYRYFASTIYKESNVFNREIKDYLKTKDAIAKEAERIEVNILDNDNELLLYITK